MTCFSSRRLNFRELHPEDVSLAYVGWLNDPAINRYLEIRFAPQDANSVRAFVSAQLGSRDSFLFRIALAESDTHIGNIKLGPINHHHKSAQISLLIGEQAHHGQGYGAEAIEAVTRWGFSEQDLVRIEGGCYADNFGSLRAFLKSRYTVEGFRRDAVVAASGERQGAFWFARVAGEKVGTS